MDRLYFKIKRIIDTVLSLFLIIILLPLFFIISIAIKIDSPGPVIFKQKRTGLNGEVFMLLKFRSMIANNDVFNFKKGDKITRVGKFLRTTSLDELPQFINILKGDMSFIGPRPWLCEYYKYFTPYQKERNLVRPGITGLAQVSGRKDLNIIERINYDVDYVRNISFLNDVKIIFKTISVIFKKDNNTYDIYTIEDEYNDLRENYKKYNSQDVFTKV